MMNGKITILGSGTSTGVPQVGCTCEVCRSDDPHDKRLRTSVLVETETERVLMDCGPDFRQQVMGLPFEKIDGVLISHEHYDHVGGLDDLRPFCKFGEVPVYAEANVAEALRARMPYCLVKHYYPGIPNISMHEVEPGVAFKIGQAEVMPVRVMHGKLPIVGFRMGTMAYVTDMLTMPEESMRLLKGLDVLIINALRIEPHWTHQTLEHALEVAEELKPKRTFLIHASHQIGLHREVQAKLPENVFLSYDSMTIYW